MNSLFKHLFLIAMVLLPSIGVSKVYAQSALQLINSEEATRLSRHVKILKEQSAVLTIEQVRARTSSFRTIPSNPNYGLSDNGIWLHSAVSNVTDVQEWVIDIGFSHLDKVDFYLFSGKELLASSNQGTLRTNQQYRFPTFKVQLPYATPIDLFVRVETANSNIIAPIDIQSYQKHLRSNFWDNLLWGLFYGGLFILAFYNLVQYVSNKELSLLAYVGYICSALIWQFIWGGHLAMLFPNGITPWLSQHVDLIFILIGAMSGLFTYSFLNAKHTAPKTATMITTSIVVFSILGFCSVFNLIPVLWQNLTVYIVGIIAILIYLAAGVESYINHFRPARYFIVAWSILAICALGGMLSLVGILPTNLLTTYCFQVGVFIEAGLFSIALMDKSRSLLESEVQQVTNDLRNNLEYNEEQNARLDIARKDAINASQIKSQFLANMSHEIRTPLNAILGFSKELTDIPLPTDKLEHVRIINSAADSLLRIVNDVLDVSKIEAGKLQISNQPFSPNDVLEDIVNVMSKSAQHKKLEFVYRISPLPERLVGDAHRIQQVLINLLGNALKFTSSGHICLTASGELLENNIYQLQFLVEDTGIGISQQDRKKLFSAFSQIDDATSRSYQGTGLGLVICQQLVHLMGGRIDLTSSPGKGSCFSVTIKSNLLNKVDTFAQNRYWQNLSVGIFDNYSLSKRSLDDLLTYAGAKPNYFESLSDSMQKVDALFVSLPQTEISQRESILNSIQPDQFNQLVLLYSGPTPEFIPEPLKLKLTATLRLPLTISKLASITGNTCVVAANNAYKSLHTLPSVKVLAVDDMEMNLRLLNTWLESSALQLTLCYSGEDAVRLCGENEYDLILMDVQMPTMDGLMASKLIRKTELNLGTPIVAVTAHALKEEQERLLASGMDDYLPKPLDLQALIELILKWCGGQQDNEQKSAAVDWAVAISRANQNVEAAQELFDAFVKQLPEMISEISVNRGASDVDGLLASVHKLHGVCCYTGVPELQSLCDEVESALKRDEHQWAFERVSALISEAERVISVKHSRP